MGEWKSYHWFTNMILPVALFVALLAVFVWVGYEAYQFVLALS